MWVFAVIGMSLFGLPEWQNLDAEPAARVVHPPDDRLRAGLPVRAVEPPGHHLERPDRDERAPRARRILQRRADGDRRGQEPQSIAHHEGLRHPGATDLLHPGTRRPRGGRRLRRPLVRGLVRRPQFALAPLHPGADARYPDPDRDPRPAALGYPAHPPVCRRAADLRHHPRRPPRVGAADRRPGDALQHRFAPRHAVHRAGPRDAGQEDLLPRSARGNRAPAAPPAPPAPHPGGSPTLFRFRAPSPPLSCEPGAAIGARQWQPRRR